MNLPPASNKHVQTTQEQFIHQSKTVVLLLFCLW